MKINMQKLNKHLFPCFVVLMLLMVLCTPLTVNADKWYDPIDYTELDYTVRYGDEYNKVIVPLPEFHYYMNICLGESPNVIVQTVHSTNWMDFVFDPSRDYVVRVYPAGSKGLLLDNIPVGSRLVFDIKLELYADSGGYYNGPNVSKVGYYYDQDGQTNRETTSIIQDYTFGESIPLEYTIDDVFGAKSFVPCAYITDFSVFNYIGVDDLNYSVVIENARLEMDISSTYWQQWQNQQNGEKLDDIKNSIEDSTDKITGAIEDSTDEILNGTPEQNEAADNFSDSMDSSIGDLESAGDSLNQVDTPEVDVDELIPNDVLLGEAYLNYVSAIKPFWDCKPLVQILTVLGALILVSVVLFGLRG